MDFKNRIKNDIKFKPSSETLLTFLTVLIMWVGYFIDQKGIFANNFVWEILIWGIGVIVIMNVCFPAWWIVVKQKEGFSGMGITTKKMKTALLLSVIIGAWRFIEIIPYMNTKGLLNVFLFNLFSIWEVSFIYAWLFTRYEKAFGKIIAIFLTAASVGLYHIGSLSINQILYLVLCIFVCAICFAITKNIFTLWPVYWVIGCSASVLKGYGAERFPSSMVIIMAVAMCFQVGYLVYIKVRKTGQYSN